MRSRDVDKIDQSALRAVVSDWIDKHPDGTLTEMADDLKKKYPASDQPDMAVMIRGEGFAELRRRTTPLPVIPPDPAAPPRAAR